TSSTPESPPARSSGPGRCSRPSAVSNSICPRPATAPPTSSMRSAGTWSGCSLCRPKPVVTGEYGDANCADEALWAAAELFRTTGGAEYRKYFLEHYAGFISTRATEPPEGWADVANRSEERRV